jgi:hypothetical protein
LRYPKSERLRYQARSLHCANRKVRSRPKSSCARHATRRCVCVRVQLKYYVEIISGISTVSSRKTLAHFAIIAFDNGDLSEIWHEIIFQRGAICMRRIMICVQQRAIKGKGTLWMLGRGWVLFAGAYIYACVRALAQMLIIRHYQGPSVHRSITKDFITWIREILSRRERE